MTDSNLLVEQSALSTFVEKAYLDYSMYVILDRALPHIADGLKPVQRRIVYAMSELGLKATAKYKKSARTVGDVLGKFHPHGDSACYEAMVLMAQPFSYRYPFIDGQGNWGSVDDPKSFAAMRYTESRLSPYAQLLLNELQQGTVEWTLNFDGTLQEPSVLPAELPNILLNGTTGIAVGMATDIPPHQLGEIADACVHLLDHPKATIQELCQIVQGPDYPTAAEIITPKQDLQTLYETGTGSIRMRAIFQQIGQDIIITSLPYQVSSNQIMEAIASQMASKKLPMISDLRDEGDHECPTRIVLSLRSNRVSADDVMPHLFATTDLERSYRVNLNMIGLNGRPQVKNLRMLLTEWLVFRQATVLRRLETRLAHLQERLSLLDALLIAYLHLDEIIHLIRTSDEPKQELMARYHLSESQAQGILDIRLRQLARLEEVKIREEQKSVQKELAEIEAILKSDKKQKALIRKEILACKAQYNDQRRCPIVTRAPALALSETTPPVQEPVTVILSQKGWVKVAKGHEVDGRQGNFRTGDHFLMQAQGSSHLPAIFLDSKGRSYGAEVSNLPKGRGDGEPLTKFFNLPAGSHGIAVLMDEPTSLYLLASSDGYGFITTFENFHTKIRNGKALLTVSESGHALQPTRLTNKDTDRIAVLTNEGYLSIFDATSLPELPKGKGNKLISWPKAKDDQAASIFCSQVLVLPKGAELSLQNNTKQWLLKPQEVEAFEGERGRRGGLLPKAFRHQVKLVLRKT